MSSISIALILLVGGIIAYAILGLIVGSLTLYLHILISPAYRRGERFSLPLLPMLILLVFHLFIGIQTVFYFIITIDLALLTFDTIASLWTLITNQNKTIWIQGTQGILYQNGTKKAMIPFNYTTEGNGIILYPYSLEQWEPPHHLEPIKDEEVTKIIKEVTDYLESKKLKVKIDMPSE